MPQSNPGHCLYLYTDLDYFPDHQPDFIHACIEKGLITTSSLVSLDEYLVGDEFLQNVTFMGCSPYLKVYPDNDQDTDFCRVEIPSRKGTIQYISIPQAIAPRCPACRKAGYFPDNIIEQWEVQHENAAITCGNCLQPSYLYDLDWRRNAGFCQFYIRISNIFPKEAIPNESLLEWLASISKTDWKYFYA